jgi:O-Antigen ligase
MSQEKIVTFFESMDSWPWQKVGLWILVFFLGALAIVMSLAGLLPLDDTHFFFIGFLALLLCLYRPEWGFYTLAFFVPFETINLAPDFLGIALRPYQLLTLALVVALALQVVTGRLSMHKMFFGKLDALLVLVWGGSLLAILGSYAPMVSLKQSLVLASFLLLYFVARFFLRQAKVRREALHFFLGGGFVVMVFALWQSVQDSLGRMSYMVMVGRPNATFFEADWLGFFVALVMVLVSSTFLFVPKAKNDSPLLFSKILYGVLLVMSSMVLILTVSRSAWLGAFVGLAFLFATFAYAVWQKKLPWTIYATRAGVVVGLSLVGFIIVNVLGLSRFDISDRASSTTNGFQVITVSCESQVVLPPRIETVSDLTAYRCRHIDLEEVASEKANGKVILEVERRDPNFAIRSEIYQKTFTIIKENPILGIGMGMSSSFLGNDERGSGLNSSNLFLETWLGAGIVGFVSLVALWTLLAVRYGQGTLLLSERHFVGGALFLALTVFNMFNAGMLLGTFFFIMALIVTWSSPLIHHNE